MTALAFAVPSAARADERLPETIDFNLHIRPILADNCFACHGPDEAERQSDLRLDRKDGAYADLGGYRAIVPGDPAASELVRRITAEDESERMPPVESGRRLTTRQVAILRNWIEQGAPWQEHWAFINPARPPRPDVRGGAWPRNAIDHFVLARLERERLEPSPEAEPRTLIRRLSLDLTGLPPARDDVASFLADRGPGAYERVVERLLASPSYGEHMAVAWLDAARFADTSGYQTDGERHMWRWRDWVIDAVNSNMPFDRFTIEQLAGDLLPEPTIDQLVATGFHRNHRANSEGGIVPEEYLVEYAADRVETTATVWLGLTVGCARCHDHKFDPITQREFYGLMAYFDNVPERGRVRKKGNEAPLVSSPTPAMQQRIEALAREIAAAERELADLQDRLIAAQQVWESSPEARSAGRWSVDKGLVAHFPLDEDLADATGVAKDVEFKVQSASFASGQPGSGAQFDGSGYVEAAGVRTFSESDPQMIGAWIFPEHLDEGTIVSRMDDDDSRDVGFSVHLADGRVQVNFGPRWLDDALRVRTRAALEPVRWQHVMITYDGSQLASGVRIYLDGEPAETDVLLDLFTGTFNTPEPLRIGSLGAAAHFQGTIDEVRCYERQLAPSEVQIVACPEAIGEISSLPRGERSAAQSAKLAAFFRAHHAPDAIRRLDERLGELRHARDALRNTAPTTMVMLERPGDHETFLLVRGQYDRPGERVSAGAPDCLPPLPKDAPRNRLGLARWLVDPENPLTARVAVNRAWQALLGTGLVATPEDFGVQGERPTHPALLDFLATELVRSEWDIKALHRLIVTSATYRQSSRVEPELLARDPDNRLLARAARVRLSAEAIRDQALAASGLLSSRLGGRSVKPYQPEGLWQELASTTYTPDTGEDLYRRSLYTFRKRTVPPPSMTTFDATARETCIMRRSRTNTPLQALALLNDVTYVEAARKVAERIIVEGGQAPTDRIGYAFELVLSRQPTAEELVALRAAQERYASHFASHSEAARQLVSTGDSRGNSALDPDQWAAYTLIATTILNLDETLTRQ